MVVVRSKILTKGAHGQPLRPMRWLYFSTPARGHRRVSRPKFESEKISCDQSPDKRCNSSSCTLSEGSLTHIEAFFYLLEQVGQFKLRIPSTRHKAVSLEQGASKNELLEGRLIPRDQPWTNNFEGHKLYPRLSNFGKNSQILLSRTFMRRRIPS